ncbi:MAG: glutamate--tRNA ligase, partial [Candidatus Bathyarchaeia archaeon]
TPQPRIEPATLPVEERRGLPPLENVDRFKEIRTRFAPNPDGPLHLGSARPIILCDEYARMYRGKFILRFEDTSPEVKAPIREMYDWIWEDLWWLGAAPDEVYHQSDRLPIYYGYAERLLTLGAAYVCTCTPAEFKKLYQAEEPCPCRDLPSEVHLDRWRRMLDGGYGKGEAVVRIKTDLHHPNPAVRDWPALRIVTAPHPRVGERYRVWPLYNYSCAIDDHEMEVSHIIRGKEHEVNTTRQRYLFKHLGWEYPEIINVGRLGLEAGVLSKSKIRRGVDSGIYTGWDDPRLGTLRALRRRGIQPETIRRLMIEVGAKPINATLSWGNIAAVNRRIIEPEANRFFFVENPTPLRVSGIDGKHVARLPLHPDHPERGTRDHAVKPEGGLASFNISQRDAEKMAPGSVVRLMGLFNVEVLEAEPARVEARYHSGDYREARSLGAPFIHWLPEAVGVAAKVVMPDASTAEGAAEPMCLDLEVDEMIQFERFGFVRVDSISPFVAYFAHT